MQRKKVLLILIGAAAIGGCAESLAMQQRLGGLAASGSPGCVPTAEMPIARQTNQIGRARREPGYPTPIIELRACYLERGIP
jgi:hypothetical protein